MKGVPVCRNTFFLSLHAMHLKLLLIIVSSLFVFKTIAQGNTNQQTKDSTFDTISAFAQIKTLLAKEFPNSIIMDTISGNLNRDKESDYIVILNSSTESSDSTTSGSPSMQRKVVLLVCKKGTFTVAKTNNTIVDCSNCNSDSISDSYRRPTIRNGRIYFLSHYGGIACDQKDINLTFSYYKRSDNWRLESYIKVDIHCQEDPKRKPEVKIYSQTASDFGAVLFDQYVGSSPFYRVLK